MTAIRINDRLRHPYSQPPRSLRPII
jgi:hypothetical protein